MRSVLAVVLCLAASSASAADLADPQTFLGQTAYDEVRISPDGARLAFITRRNDFERDREVFALWLARSRASPRVRFKSRRRRAAQVCAGRRTGAP